MRRLRLAVVGKGGAGKSTLSGTMARLLARRGARVLALDSDPMPGLSISLGLGPRDDAMLTDAAEREDCRWRLKAGIGPARAASRFSIEAPDGVHFLQFGKATADGLRPILASVNAFNEIVRRLAEERVMIDWSIVGDLSAGPRQAAYHWAPYADTYLVVVEPTWQSVLTGRRLIDLAEARDPRRVAVVANKVSDDADFSFVSDQVGREPLAVLPSHPSVRNADRRGLALIDHAPDSPVVEATDALLTTLTGGLEPSDR